MSRHIQRQPLSRLGSFLGLAVALLMAAAGYALGPADSAANQEAESAESGRGGFDVFTTKTQGTFFDFSGEFALPAGFFDRRSARFEGRVPFQGVPIRTFRGRKVGNADTVVARTKMPKLSGPFPRRGTAEIELVELSLASAEPLKVTVGDSTQLWDVKLLLSKKRPRSGKMTIVQQNERGGVFDSEFRVLPLLKFVRRGDKAERTLDVGAMKLGQAGTQRMTLKATSVPWATKAPANAVSLSEGFFPGVKIDTGVAVPVTIQHHNHEIEIAIML